MLHMVKFFQFLRIDFEIQLQWANYYYKVYA